MKETWKKDVRDQEKGKLRFSVEMFNIVLRILRIMMNNLIIVNEKNVRVWDISYPTQSLVSLTIHFSHMVTWVQVESESIKSKQLLHFKPVSFPFATQI